MKIPATVVSPPTSPDVPRKPWWPWLVGALVVVGAGKLGTDYWVRRTFDRRGEAASPRHQQALNQNLIQTISQHDLAYVRHAFETGFSVNTVTREGETLVSAALQAEAWDIAEFCVTHGFVPATPYQGINGRSDGQAGDLALYWACRQGRSELVEKLLAAGAQPDGRNAADLGKFGAPLGLIYPHNPLAAAVEKGDHATIRLLLKKGANPKGLFNEGEPLLRITTRTRDLPTLKLLLELGVTHENLSIDQRYFTLGYALERHWPEGVQAMLDAGFDARAAAYQEHLYDPENKTAHDLILAKVTPFRFQLGREGTPKANAAAQEIAPLFFQDTPGLVARLSRLDPAVVDVVDDAGRNLVCYAVEAGRIDCVRALADHGARLNLVPPYSPASLAVKNGNLPMLEYLVKKGVDPNLADPSLLDGSLLKIAIQGGNRTLFDWLLARGARINPVNSQAREITPLMTAMSAGHEELAQRLLAMGAKVDAVTSGNMTVTLFGATGKNPAIVHLLEAYGVDLNHEKARATSVLAGAIRTADLSVVRALLAWGVAEPPNATAFLNSASDHKSNAELTRLLEAYAKTNPPVDTVEEVKRKAGPVTREVAFWGNLGGRSLPEVKDFLAAGGQVNFLGASTPLQEALECSRADIVELLLAKGADPNAHGRQDYDPILIAAVRSERMSDEDRSRTLKLLVQHGANLEAVITTAPGDMLSESDGQTALMNSVVRGSVVSTRTLLELGADVWARDTAGRTPFDYLKLGNAYTEATARLIRDLLLEAQKKQPKPGERKKPAIKTL